MNERNLLSALLMDTSEEQHMKCDIILQTSEDCGLGELEKLHITEIWQWPTEGWIDIHIEGFGDCALDDYEEFIPQIYKELIEQEEQA